MREYRFAIALAASTFVLLLIGGLVHATGSSLACPDWPLCYGQFFPPMRGGIFFEHGHRLAAAAVAILTAGVCALCWKYRRATDRGAAWLATLALGLVLFQAALGAITVKYKLPLFVSTGHLATSMAFFSLTLYLPFRLRPGAGGAATLAGRALAGLAAAAVYLQIVLGAFVRHTGSGLACSTTLLNCNGVLWPEWGPARLHMIHRAGALLVAALVFVTAARVFPAARRAGRKAAAWLALAAVATVVLQIVFGALTVVTYIAIPVVETHLGLGALLLAESVGLFLALGPRGARAATATDADDTVAAAA